MFEHTRARPGDTGALRHTPTPIPVPSLRERINGLRAEWRRLARVLADPAVELDVEEFSAVLVCYTRLKAAGAALDPMAEALVLQLSHQLAASKPCL